ncbi:MAG TPA: hypothetical protein VNU48_04890 [Burkholderiaceae bacterium]|nr:hypothetical protein [Burkholderiaceae bacterium]
MKPRLLCLMLACAASAGTWAADAEHDRIAAERASADARLAAQQRECAARFVVAACVEDARAEHRATLARLRQQQLQIDETRRRETAAARRKAIAERVEAQQARASDVPPEAPRVNVRRAPEPAPALRPAEPMLPRAPAVGASSADRATFEQRNQAKFDARARAAQAHREDVERRNARRAAQGKVAAPLPAASGASTAR